MGLVPAWTLAVELSNALGGFGAAAAELRFARSRMGGNAGPQLATLPYDLTMTRSVPLAKPDESAIGSVQREMERASGLWSLEDHR
jgi:hypothetical protein